MVTKKKVLFCIAKKKKRLSGERSTGARKKRGFSLIETTIAIALVGIALLGLVQLFTYSVMNNARSDRITSATFLAQQQIDFLRNQSATDLNILALSPIDEQIDVNSDGVFDFRRLTHIQASGFYWEVRVRVFPPSQFGTDIDDLVNDPIRHKIRADMVTMIGR